MMPHAELPLFAYTYASATSNPPVVVSEMIRPVEEAVPAPLLMDDGEADLQAGPAAASGIWQSLLERKAAVSS